MSLAAIGQKLRSAREAQGLTLVQVFERTKIPLNHLQAVEEGDTEELPEPVFVQGFLKRYAECIGLDGQVIADEYRQHEEASNNGRKNHHAAVPYYASNEYLSKSKVRAGTPAYKLWFFNSIIIIGVIGALTWFINWQNSISNQTDPSLNGLRNATRGLAPVAPLPNQPAQPAQGTAQQPAQELGQRITLSAIRHVWVEVKRLSNGDSVFTGNLEQGDRRDFDDSQGLFIRAGDGGALSVDDHKGKVETFGLNGKVSERQFGSAQAAAGAPATGTQAKTAATSSPGSAAVAARPFVKRVRRQASASGDVPARPRHVETRRYESPTREAPARYSEGRLDSD